MRSLFLALALIPLASPVAAGETAWQEVAPGVKLRLISTGQVKPDGTTLLGLELDMPASSKTYWRVPGDTGLPMELDFSGSEGVMGHEVLWPYPTRQESGDYLDYVYFGPTVLPLQLTLAPGAAKVELGAMLGVCSDICVPAQARFSLPLEEGTPDRPNGLRIRQALANVPIAWEGEREPVGTVALEEGAAMLAVEVTEPGLDPASLIAATESGQPLFGTPQKSPEPDLVLIPILGKSDEIDLENQDVQLTFLTEMGAFEVTRTVLEPSTN